MANRILCKYYFIMALSLAVWTGAHAAQQPASSYISCINAQMANVQPTTYHDFVAGKPTRWVLLAL